MNSDENEPHLNAGRIHTIGIIYIRGIDTKNSIADEDSAGPRCCPTVGRDDFCTLREICFVMFVPLIVLLNAYWVANASTRV
jgi:hypothetical protein